MNEFNDQLLPNGPLVCLRYQADETLALFACQALEEDAMRKVQGHLDECAVCRTQVAAYQSLRESGRQLITRMLAPRHPLTLQDILRRARMLHPANEVIPAVLPSEPMGEPMGEAGDEASDEASDEAGEGLAPQTVGGALRGSDVHASAAALRSSAPLLDLFPDPQTLTPSLRLPDHPTWHSKPQYSRPVAGALIEVYGTLGQTSDRAPGCLGAAVGLPAYTHRPMADEQRLRVAYVHARAYVVQQQYQLALAAFDRAAKDAAHVGDLLALAECAYRAGLVEQMAGQLEAAVDYFEIALESVHTAAPEERETESAITLEALVACALQQARSTAGSALQAAEIATWLAHGRSAS